MPTSEQISNGGYKVYDGAGLDDIDPGECSWNNVCILVIEYRRLKDAISFFELSGWE